MAGNIDMFVCNPTLGINRELSGVFIDFEVADLSTQQGTGKRHAVAMRTADAMLLLRHLENVQQQFDLAKPEGEATMVDLSIPKNKN
jgi:hypothetical protein